VKKVVIYSKSDCNFCVQAERACRQLVLVDREFSYSVLKLNTDYSIEDFTAKFPYARTVPQIIVDDVHVGGWDDWKSDALAKIQGV
jgi:glutaredoxin